MEDPCKGGWHAQAAEFPSIHRIGSGGCDACPGADLDNGGRTSRRRNERYHIDPGFFPSSRPPPPRAAKLDWYSPRPAGRSRSHLPRPEEGAEGPAYPKQSQGAAAANFGVLSETPANYRPQIYTSNKVRENYVRAVRAPGGPPP